ncbi:MAG TPA: succinate dehydrogenase, cytochrome b556 subunit [Rhodospirillaceae bacterium]|nr:succinate dehydrogenase, cytochrome b556 subunit [Candidatus Neomarinimicrobiota bacterium]HCX14718.1 succinate dehydrogenase, cytochrome b556 subunit [Rhodospirillaceae bacterium]
MTQRSKLADRPLSPHLQVYRLPLTALTSIFHRITGVGLSLGMILLVVWLVAAAFGSGAYGIATEFITSPIGYLLLFGFSVALFFHLCNGIRHLFWDVGMNFEIEETKRSNVLVILFSIVLTVVSWYMALV